MTLAELVTSFLAQGFDYLSTPEAERYLNDAYQIDICDAEDWPFLEASKEGTAPLTITDLRVVQEVIDTTQEVRLLPLQRARITDSLGTDLTASGAPSLYYVTGGNTIHVYQANTTDELLVRYFKTPETLTSSSVPLVPSRYHTLIVDGAKARAYENSDDYELAQNARENFTGRLQRMRESVLDVQHDAPDEFVVLTDPESY